MLSLYKCCLVLAILFSPRVSGTRMSLAPFLDDYRRHTRLLDQHFGLEITPDELLEPLILSNFLRNPGGYLRPWKLATRNDLGSTIKFEDDKFTANLDVQQFEPGEITVKLSGEREVTIEGKHEEKQDEHGYVSRHFVRRYRLPKEFDTNQIQSKLSSDGVLTISAPLINEKVKEKTIPIEQTGQPARISEDKKTEKNEL
ncbi:unnamed protein product [Acanthoscelides obtectus]|uniref:SHSP domain-containing protein n=1 Tax=Acanthoscelides obtectus TaxID=200917 RepID=A0A9P0LW19_ACAOB|nr:unnamed protein product [Acanthoscelides obtectus]CAK1646275.1 Protein lethal(2)essential for life [Acanthoscelides obtectus]